MVASDWGKVLKQLESKPAIKARFLKFCKPKDRKFGIAHQKCTRCGRYGTHIGKYNLHLCRHCFRETAERIGFKKYM
jgi:small subunit ribosomal protein S14